MIRMLRLSNVPFALVTAFALVAGTVACATAQDPQAAPAPQAAMAPQAAQAPQAAKAPLVAQASQAAQAPQAAQAAWVDKVGNSMAFYKKQYTTVTYPGSKWEVSAWGPYEKQLAMVRDAANKGDKAKAKEERDKFLTMLLNREHGIHTTAANGLYHETLSLSYDALK